MGLEVKRASLLHRNRFITDARLFSKLIDLAADGDVESEGSSRPRNRGLGAIHLSAFLCFCGWPIFLQ